ncbi:MAG: hypothetical protein AB2375_04905 [Tissierellaceae bacterium]
MELIIVVIAAMGGGIFASIIGGTNAFIFTGLTGLAGIIMQMSGGGEAFLTDIAGGPFFGPHVAFNSGVVALALLKRIKSNDKEGEVIDGTNTFLPLYKYKEILPIVAAGVTGGLGYLVNLFFGKLELNFDTVAFTIVIFNIATRLIIGKTGLVPKLPSDKERYEEVNKNFLFSVIWGVGLSAVVAYITLLTKNNLIGFYISAVSLVLLSLGKDIPATHHISLVTGYAALKFGNIYLAILFGILATIFGEYFNVTVNTEADTLIDMPSAVIALLSFVIFSF